MKLFYSSNIIQLETILVCKENILRTRCIKNIPFYFEDNGFYRSKITQIFFLPDPTLQKDRTVNKQINRFSFFIVV